jgi:hypothetical protein
MIAIKYQLFFFDPSQNRENQLSAIQPFFNSPSAIKVLLKTAKFEGKSALVYSGQEDSLEEFLKNIARSDTTDWLSFDFDKIAGAMDAMANELGLAKFNIKINDDDEQVLGDPPHQVEEKVKVEGLSKKDLYPSDIPEKSRWLWDDVKKNFRGEIKKRSGKDLDKKEAVTRILYANSALKLGIIPYSMHTVNQVNDARDTLCDDIEQGEARASDFIDTWERHLKSDGTLKRTRAIKYLGSEFEEISSRYYIAHVIEWTLGVDWRTLSDYLKKNHGFQVISKDHLTMTINKLTKLEVIQDETSIVSIYVSHLLTPSQAATLTAKSDKESIVKMLHKYATLWYKNGRFPDVKKL